MKAGENVRWRLDLAQAKYLHLVRAHRGNLCNLRARCFLFGSENLLRGSLDRPIWQCGHFGVGSWTDCLYWVLLAGKRTKPAEVCEVPPILWAITQTCLSCRKVFCDELRGRWRVHLSTYGCQLRFSQQSPCTDNYRKRDAG